ncbi:MAG: helix-turn-helix transcriptional regulator [Chthoniobacterales bacterium]
MKARPETISASAWTGRPALRLQAASGIHEYWAAAQDLVAAAAPSATRWLCLRPIGMRTALVLLRETAARGRKKKQVSLVGEAEFLRDLFSHHPAILHLHGNAEKAVVRLAPSVMQSLPQSSHSVLREQRGKFGAALAFWKGKRLEGVLVLHRSEEEGDFTKEEWRRLRQIHPHLQTALHRLIAHRGHLAHKKLLHDILEPLPLPMVLCDHRLSVVSETAAGLAARTAWAAADERSRIWNRARGTPLPEDLADLCRERIAVWEKSDAVQRARLEKHESESRHPRVPKLRVRLRLVRDKRFPLVRPLLLFRFETTSLSANNGHEQASAPRFAGLAPLSAAEREIALLVCRGQSNAAIAHQVGKSIHTIKTQLNSIFEKLEVKSRAKLIAALMGKTIPLHLSLAD